MFSNYVFAFSVLSLLVMGQPGTICAADSCQPVFDALTKLITTSSHKLFHRCCEW